MKPPAHHVFPCARCDTPINCWPHRAGKSVCGDCLIAIKRENGVKRGASQPKPQQGDTKIRTIRGRQYRWIFDDGAWVAEHRLTMELSLGRGLHPGEVVHHDNRDSLDNRPSNLILVESKGKHLAEHHSAEGVRVRMAGYPSCKSCGERTAYGLDTCWACWSADQTCPTCGREHRKMARRDMCHGCYKALRKHRKAQPDEETRTPVVGSG